MYIRKKGTGDLVAEVDNRIAGKMLQDITGAWQEKHFTGGTKKTVFVFNTFCAYGNTMMKIYVHEGDYMADVL